MPILSFLPVVLLSLSAVLPQQIAAELAAAAIVLIFTSQTWNLVFAWYQALKTIPHELDEVSSMYDLDDWYDFPTPWWTAHLLNPTPPRADKMGERSTQGGDACRDS